jgi:hypothetical protein
VVVVVKRIERKRTCKIPGLWENRKLASTPEFLAFLPNSTATYLHETVFFEGQWFLSI